MRRITLLAPVVVASLGAVQQQAVLDAASLYDLHDSADRVKLRRELSPGEFAALEEALDVLVGDDARRLMEKMERIEVSSRPLPAAVRLAAEARVLAPVDGLTFEGLVTAAVDKTRDRRTGLLGDLRSEKAAAPKSRRELEKIDVVSAAYWRSVTTGERAIDFTIRNGSEQPLYALVLDCRLIDTHRRQTREHGTCRVEFEGGLAPGSATAVTAPVAWEARQLLGWTVDARPIRAYDAAGDALWEVASELDPHQGGHIAELESEIADLDQDLESLGVDRMAPH